MKTLLFRSLCVWVAFGLITFSSIAQQRHSILETVNKHQQIYPSSCIPSSIEMILKYNHKLSDNYFGLQNGWRNKNDGTFGNFNGKTIKGIKFKQQFQNQRNANFPFNALYKTISDELASGRKVIISLVSGQNLWHMWVIDGKSESGDFIAYSRDFNNDYPMVISDVKKRVQAMQGTDIITYRLL
ncbi:hypothetical protein OQZ29_04355 [Pedobacter agri]|uniref:Uncharacterized protein n=3 Tax=Pedobacter agri TaxID=454586 RepID=A0A9X3DAD4_9SPHI|nr:hypothetical protein [Pedobacter agri]MCX3263963.1 hypothetical protein [Pedobacter agri]